MKTEALWKQILFQSLMPGTNRICHLTLSDLHCPYLFAQMAEDPTMLLQLLTPLGDMLGLSFGTISALSSTSLFKPQKGECSYMTVVRASLTQMSHDLRGKRVWSLGVLFLTKQETKMSFNCCMVVTKRAWVWKPLAGMAYSNSPTWLLL